MQDVHVNGAKPYKPTLLILPLKRIFQSRMHMPSQMNIWRLPVADLNRKIDFI